MWEKLGQKKGSTGSSFTAASCGEPGAPRALRRSGLCLHRLRALPAPGPGLTDLEPFGILDPEHYALDYLYLVPEL